MTGQWHVYNFSCAPSEAYEANGFVVHNCFYANTGELGSHRNVFLDQNRMCDLFVECRDLGVKSITWTGGGDPSLHPAIDDFVTVASDYGIEQGMFTNVLAMPKYDPALLAWVRVTMTDRPYNLPAIKALRSCPVLGFAFNYAGPKDDDYLVETLVVAQHVGADYVQCRPALAFHGQTVDIRPPTFQHPLLYITDYKFEDARRPHGYLRCEGYHFLPFVWEDNVDVCAYNRMYPGYTLGNIYESSLKEILDRAPDGVPVHEKCQVCCKNHEINKTVHHARALRDVNFP